MGCNALLTQLTVRLPPGQQIEWNVVPPDIINCMTTPWTAHQIGCDVQGGQIGEVLNTASLQNAPQLQNHKQTR